MSAYNSIMDLSQELSQRSRLRFCKAFFEVVDPAAIHERLLRLGAQELGGASDEAPVNRWYWWHGEFSKGNHGRDGVVLRLYPERLVLEGATARLVSRGWRALDEELRPLARARVAARDDLARFVPGQRPYIADQPDTWDVKHEARVLAEFYTSFATRWARQPQARLDGMSPLEAVCYPEKRAWVHELLSRMQRVEEERRQRGMASFAVEDLRRAVFGVGGDVE